MHIEDTGVIYSIYELGTPAQIVPELQWELSIISPSALFYQSDFFVCNLIKHVSNYDSYMKYCKTGTFRDMKNSRIQEGYSFANPVIEEVPRQVIMTYRKFSRKFLARKKFLFCSVTQGSCWPKVGSCVWANLDTSQGLRGYSLILESESCIIEFNATSNQDNIKQPLKYISCSTIHIYFLRSVHPWFTALKRWNRWTYGLHISVSIPTPLAVAGPHGQLASNNIVAVVRNSVHQFSSKASLLYTL